MRQSTLFEKRKPSDAMMFVCIVRSSTPLKNFITILLHPEMVARDSLIIHRPAVSLVY